ncbi:hypothetical protein N658DRAFT_148830 [Parathielavia hyrcaniae]|uniref:Uncharacterized protein n=1 Tax=Parathielavia hyrcaniae TaxID=113614 RepID=A0AAN6Q2S6_9PEZI|nr:hypothetical protein N658DRAFT_148830 [Parathielavia hyrcaniae]
MHCRKQSNRMIVTSTGSMITDHVSQRRLSRQLNKTSARSVSSLAPHHPVSRPSHWLAGQLSMKREPSSKSRGTRSTCAGFLGNQLDWPAATLSSLPTNPGRVPASVTRRVAVAIAVAVANRWKPRRLSFIVHSVLNFLQEVSSVIALSNRPQLKSSPNPAEQISRKQREIVSKNSGCLLPWLAQMYCVISCSAADNVAVGDMMGGVGSLEAILGNRSVHRNVRASECRSKRW